MKIYLQNIVKDLKQFSLSLDKESMLVNKPWALIDSEFNFQKLIFRKNKEVIFSKDGIVTEGRWEYLSEAKCLLIDRGVDKILCNEMYFDDSVLMLKIDGKADTFFVLANENNLPDLDAYSYLRKLFYNKYGILYMPLANDRYLKIKPNHNNELGVGSEVSIDTGDIKEGTFLSQEEDKKISVKDNKIIALSYLQRYEVGDNNYINIEQVNKLNVNLGDKVTYNESEVDNDIFLLSGKGIRIYVVDSKVSKIIYLKSYETIDSKKILIEQAKIFEYRAGDKVYHNGKPLSDGKYEIIENRRILVKDGKVTKTGLPEGEITFILIVIIGIVIMGFISIFNITT